MVKNGKITEDQKVTILAKWKEIDETYNLSSKNLTVEERKEMTEKIQEELKEWTEEQGIDPTYVQMMIGGSKQTRDGQPGDMLNHGGTLLNGQILILK